MSRREQRDIGGAGSESKNEGEAEIFSRLAEDSWVLGAKIHDDDAMHGKMKGRGV